MCLLCVQITCLQNCFETELYLVLILSLKRLKLSSVILIFGLFQSRSKFCCTLVYGSECITYVYLTRCAYNLNFCGNVTKWHNDINDVTRPPASWLGDHLTRDQTTTWSGLTWFHWMITLTGSTGIKFTTVITLTHSPYMVVRMFTGLVVRLSALQHIREECLSNCV